MLVIAMCLGGTTVQAQTSTIVPTVSDLAQGWVFGYRDNTPVLMHHVGRTWTPIKVPQPPTLLSDVNNSDGLSNVAMIFSSRTTGFLAWKLPNRNMIRVLSTTNAGSSWNVHSFTVPKSVWDVSQVDLLNGRDAWIQLQGQGVTGSLPSWLYKTTNGGKSWSQNGNTGKLMRNADGATMYFASPTTGWWAFPNVLNTGVYLYQTRNGGNTWAKISLPDPLTKSISTSVLSLSGRGNIVTFLDDLEVTGLKTIPVLYTSDNGGATWKYHILARFSGTYISSFEGRYGWIVADGKLYYTKNQGASWTQVVSSQFANLARMNHVTGISMTSPKDGQLILSEKGMPNHTEIYTTFNAGRSWEPAIR